MGVLDIITILIVLATVFSMINLTILKLPSTIGLMAIGLALSLLVMLLGKVMPGLAETAHSMMDGFDFKEVLLNIMLSFLLFAGAISMNLKKLMEEKWVILILATFGVVMTTFLIGTGLYYALYALHYIQYGEAEYLYCLLFGALISPTDPIAVLALIKKAGLSKNLETKIAGESLFNDGIGVVVFLGILGIVETGGGREGLHLNEIGLLFLTEVGGGVLLGLVLGFVGLRVLQFIDNEHAEIEVLVTLSLVLGGNRLAELMHHVSGPLAMVTMGLFISKEGSQSENGDSATGEYVYKFWHLLDETLNAILFILIGFEMIVIGEKYSMELFAIALIAIPIVLLARFLGVSIPVTLLSFFRKFEKNTISILTWGGLRGGLSVAMALSLPEEVPEEIRNMILVTTYSIVVFSILFQGLTINKLIK